MRIMDEVKELMKEKEDVMKHIEKIDGYFEIFTFIVFIIIVLVNSFLYAGLFDQLIFKFMFFIFIISILKRMKVMKKIRKLLILLLIIIEVALPIIFICNIPEYTYPQAVKLIGEAKYKQGAKSFQYESKSITFYSETYSNLFTGKDYFIRVNVDGETLGYHVNPYNGKLKEAPIIYSDEQKRELKYKSLY